MKKVGKNSVDGEALHLIILRGEMEFKFAKNAKKKKKILSLSFKFFFNFETLIMHVNIIWFQLWNLQQVKKKNCKRSDIDWANWFFLSLSFAFCPCPTFPPFTLVQFGHYKDWTFTPLGEWKGVNHQAIFISNDLKLFRHTLNSSKNPKVRPKAKQQTKKRVGEHSLTHNTSRVGGHVKDLGWD